MLNQLTKLVLDATYLGAWHYYYDGTIIRLLGMLIQQLSKWIDFSIWSGALHYCGYRASTGLRTGYISESTLRGLCDAFLPNLHSRSVSEVPPRRLQLQSGEKGEKKAPIRIVLLITNGGLLWRLPFSRQTCVQSREATHIFPRLLGDIT